MATNIVQMTDGTGNKQYPVTSAEAVGMPDGTGNLTNYLDKRVTEYNVSVLHPTSGSGGSNKYTLETAIAQVPSKYRSVGLKCSFINEAGKPECWKYQGGSWVAASFEKEADGGNKILEWVTDAATTRKQVVQSERKSLLQVSYKNADGDIVNEQYIGTTFTDTEWIKESNWKNLLPIEQELSVDDAAKNKLLSLKSISNKFNDTILNTNIRASYPFEQSESVINIFESAEILPNAMFQNEQIVASETNDCLLVRLPPHKYRVDRGSNYTCTYSQITSLEEFVVGGKCFNTYKGDPKDVDLRNSIGETYIIFNTTHDTANITCKLYIDNTPYINSMVDIGENEIHQELSMSADDFVQDGATIKTNPIYWAENKYLLAVPPVRNYDNYYYISRLDRGFSTSGKSIIIEGEWNTMSVGTRRYNEDFLILYIAKREKIRTSPIVPMTVDELGDSSVSLNLYNKVIPQNIQFTTDDFINATWDSSYSVLNTPNNDTGILPFFLPIIKGKPIYVSIVRNSEANQLSRVNVIGYNLLRNNSKKSEVMTNIDTVSSCRFAYHVPDNYKDEFFLLTLQIANISNVDKVLIGYENIDAYKKPSLDQSNNYGGYRFLIESGVIVNAGDSNLLLDMRDIAYLRFESETNSAEKHIYWFKDTDLLKLKDNYVSSSYYIPKNGITIKKPDGIKMAIIGVVPGTKIFLVYNDVGVNKKLEHGYDGYNGKEITPTFEHYVKWNIIGDIPSLAGPTNSETNAPSPQGMAIYGTRAIYGNPYLNSKSMYFIMFEHFSGKFLDKLEVDNAPEGMWHVNSISFTNQFYDKTDEFPLFITSGNADTAHLDTDPYALHVCRIIKEDNHYKIHRIQRILLVIDDHWFPDLIGLDNSKNIMYISAHTNDNLHTDIYTATIPNYADHDAIQDTITYNVSNLINKSQIDYANSKQDGVFYNNILYMLAGLGTSEQPFTIIALDNEGQLINRCELRNIPYEPEGIDVYNNEFVISTLRPSILMSLKMI